MGKIVTLGEIMLRLSTPGNTRFVQSDNFDVVYGGGEANVAVSCANYGHDAYFVTKLPKHEIGQSAVNALRKYGVKTDFIARGGDRVGIYYLETGASMRPSKVIYDRAHSAIAEADPCDFDFDAIMEGADWFHWSGITPAISDKAAELTKLACEAAKRHGVTVSVDLNFRKKLWTKEKAQSIMRPLMQYVDVCIGNEEDAELCLGFKPDADVEGGKTDAEGYKGIFTAMAKEFGFKYVISTLRESFSATHNGWKAMIYNGEEFYTSKRYDINPIIDRVGIYYLETGASMRPSKVIYDRAHSAIAEADAADFDFDAIMEGADWFHWSGITPAISDKAAELTKLACEAAKRHGVTVSVDLNFRKKLWTKEKAQSIMKPLMQYVDVCIGNEEDAELCLGFKPEANVEAGETNAEGYKGIFKAMAKEFGFKYVVSTLRESFSATHNGWKAMIYNGEEFYESKRYDINPIIDRVGGGDSFSGGIIHGLLTKPNQGAALEFAVAASALKHTINGDFNLVSVDEVEALAGGDASGRVQR